MKKDFLYVLVQFGLFVLYFFSWSLYPIDLPEWIGYLGLVLLAGGIIVILFGILNLNENLSPFPSPKENAELIQNGIYKYIRHPIYSGILLAMTGFALFNSSLEKIVITVLMAVVFYYKSDYEEKLLIKKYAPYEQYRKLTGRFFPKKPE
ncbi:MAG: isoprenylcysteine carboxylmethyltransferase family protein [Gilvibacter sp.]